MPYEKQTFIDEVLDVAGNVVIEGTTLRAEHLNHIEDGLCELDTKVGNLAMSTGSTAVFNSILKLLRRAVYDTDMSESLEELEKDIQSIPDIDPNPNPEPDGKPVYKWVVGFNGSYVSGTNEALLYSNQPHRAMCLAEGVGVPIQYGADYAPTETSPYSPVVIPDGAVSVTVKCPGFRISFNELKSVDSTWYRLFTSDSTPVADEVTYVFKSTESKGLYIKLRHLTDDAAVLTDVPETPDITFNYADEPEGEPVYNWVVGLNGTADSNGVAVLTYPSPARAMALAENTGIPLYYGDAGNVPTDLSPYSPVVIPDGAVSVTVKCPGFRIGLNELKLVGSTWYRQFSSDSTPVADEVTYTFKSTESKGLYIKLRHLTEDWTDLSDVPETLDITFNY